MVNTDIAEAKGQLAALVERVRAGEDVLIAKGGKPVARLVRVERPRRLSRRLGLPARYAGRFGRG